MESKYNWGARARRVSAREASVMDSNKNEHLITGRKLLN
jgi:hypothetical protein